MEKMFKECGRRRTTDDGRQRHTYTISSPNEPKGSGELIKKPVVAAKNSTRSAELAIHGILAPPTIASSHDER